MSRVSPSTLQGQQQCPCYQHKDTTEKDPDTQETVEERGTRLHGIMVSKDLDQCKSQEERQHISFALAYLENVLSGVNPGEQVEILQEQEVPIPGLRGRKGTLDFALIRGAKATLLDWKFIRSFSVVEPKDNLQLKSYAGGLLLTRPALEEVSATFVAPAMMLTPDPVIVRRSDLAELTSTIEAIAAAVDDVFKTPRTCDYCDNCRNAARCSALGGTVALVANRLGLPVPASITPSAAVTPRDRGVIQLLAAAVTAWAEAAKEQNIEAAKQGVEVMGHRLVTRQGSLQIAKETRDVVTELQHAPDGIRLPLPDILEATRLTLSKLIKIVAQVHGVSEAKAEDAVVEWLQASGLAVRGKDIQYLAKVKGLDIKQLMSGE